MKPTTKSDETRARILAAAIDLFRRRGFDATTMREIAAEAEMATGAAYYYFDSKDAIVLAFYDQAMREMEPLLEQALRTAAAENISGQAVTPFVLSFLHERSGGRTLEVNRELVAANAGLAAQVAVAFSRISPR